MLEEKVMEGYVRQHISSTSNLLSASSAIPDSNSSSLDSVLSAEGACVSGMLCDFHLLYLFSERGTITDTVFTGCSDLLCSFCHYSCWKIESLAILFPFCCHHIIHSPQFWSRVFRIENGVLLYRSKMFGMRARNIVLCIFDWYSNSGCMLTHFCVWFIWSGTWGFRDVLWMS